VSGFPNFPREFRTLPCPNLLAIFEIFFLATSRITIADEPLILRVIYIGDVGLKSSAVLHRMIP
jgi:hypothetical protein